MCGPPEPSKAKGRPPRLSAEDVGKIRRLRKAGLKGAAVARIFGIDESYVSRIVNGSRRTNV